MTIITPLYKGLKVGVNVQELHRLVEEYKATATPEEALTLRDSGIDHWPILAAENKGVLDLNTYTNEKDGRTYCKAPFPITSLHYPFRPAITPLDEGHVLIYIDWTASHLQLTAFGSDDQNLIDDLRTGNNYTTMFKGFTEADRKMVKVAVLAYLNGGRKDACMAKTEGMKKGIGMTEAQADSFLTQMDTLLKGRWKKANTYLNELRTLAVNEKWTDTWAKGAGVALMNIEAKRLQAALKGSKLEGHDARILIPHHDAVLLSAHKDIAVNYAKAVSIYMVHQSTGSKDEAENHTDTWVKSVITESWTGDVARMTGQALRQQALGYFNSTDTYELAIAAAVFPADMDMEIKKHHHNTERGKALRVAKATVDAAHGWLDSSNARRTSTAVLDDLNKRFTYVAERDEVYDSEHNCWLAPSAFAKVSPTHARWMNPRNAGNRTTKMRTTFRTDGVEEPEVLNGFDRNKMPTPSLIDIDNDPTTCPADLWGLVLNLTDNNTTEANYLLDWLSYRIQFPHRPQVALVLTGPEGTGKGLFSNIAQYLTGPYHSSATQSALESDWNDHLLNSILVVANEISGSTMRDIRKVANALKDQVLAGEKVRVNPKSRPVFEIYNSTGWIICTNHNLAVHLGTSDRRYSIVQGNGPLNAFAAGEALIERVLAGRKDEVWLQNVTDHIYQRDLSGFIYNRPLENEARQRAAEESMLPTERWWKETMSAEGQVAPGDYPTRYLWTQYKEDAENAGENPMPLSTFQRSIPSDLLRPQVQRSAIRAVYLINVKGNRVRCISIPNYGQTPDTRFPLPRQPWNDHRFDTSLLD